MTDIAAITSTTNTSAMSASTVDPSSMQPDTKSGSIGSMGFDDFVDMVNPLEHIPLVSSIYRAVTGETINPLARIAGDALYGGVFGLASAGISALGALGDEIYAASNDGKSASSTIVAALFGDDSDNSVQLASNSEDTKAAPSTPSVASNLPTTLAAQVSLQNAAVLQTPAQQSPILQIPDFYNPAAKTAIASASTPSATPVAPSSFSSTPPSSTMTEAATMPALSPTTGLSIDRSKQAYGGVMDTAMMQNALQNQSLALALASGQDNLQSQHALRNNRFSTNLASPTTAPTAQSASLSLPGSATNVSMSNATNAALAPGQSIAAAQAQASAQTPGQSFPQGLRQTTPQGASAELKAIKGLNQYRSTAQSIPVMGSAVDVSN